MKPGARWRDAEVPWFVTVLGAPPRGNAVSRLRTQYSLVDKSSGPEATSGWFENDELGISVAFIRGWVDCIMFCAQAEKGFGGPHTPCFFGARWGMSAEHVHRLFGPPDAVIEPRLTISLPHAGIDRYHRQGFTVAFIYDAVTGGLEMQHFEPIEV